MYRLYLHVSHPHGNDKIEQRNGIDDESQFLVGEEWVDQHKGEGGSSKCEGPSFVSNNSPGDKEGGEEETARQGRVKVPEKWKCLGGVRESVCTCVYNVVSYRMQSAYIMCYIRLRIRPTGGSCSWLCWTRAPPPLATPTSSIALSPPAQSALQGRDSLATTVLLIQNA